MAVASNSLQNCFKKENQLVSLTFGLWVISRGCTASVLDFALGLVMAEWKGVGERSRGAERGPT